MTLSVEGIILKNFNYGENHKIIRVLTRHNGLVGIFIQNANKVNTKKSALVQPLTCAHFNLKSSTNSTSDLYYLYQGDVTDYFLNVKSDYETVTYFYQMVEIIIKGLQDAEVTPSVFDMLKKFLKAADEGYSVKLLRVTFQLKMLRLLGIQPILDYCIQCQTTENIVMLSVSQGGMVCGHCLHGNEPRLIDASLIPLIRAIEKIDINNLPEVELEDELLEPIESFLEAYYEAYTGFTLKTQQFIKTLKKTE